MLPPLGNDDTHFTFVGLRLRQTLTFEWFVTNVMCPEKQELCENPRETDERLRNSQGTNEQTRRLLFQEANEWNFRTSFMPSGNKTHA